MATYEAENSTERKLMKAYTPMNWVRRKTWIGIILIAIGLLGWWFQEIKAVHKETAKNARVVVTVPPNSPKSQPPRNQQEKTYHTNIMLVVSPTNLMNRKIPFGKGCDIEVGGKVYAFKNGVPLRDENNNHVVLSPGDGAKWSNQWGYNCSEVGFKSAESNKVVVILHFYNYNAR